MVQNCQKYGTLLMVMILVPSMAYIFTIRFFNDNSENPSESISSSSSGWSGGTHLEFEDFYTINGYAEEEIVWEFTGEPNYIGITLIIIDSQLYNAFLDLVNQMGLNLTVESFSQFFVSENTSINSGIFYPGINYNTYYLIFINLDEDMQTSNLYFDVDFDPYDPNYVYTSPLVFLNIIYWIVIGVVIIGIIVKLIRKEKNKSKNINSSSYPYNYRRQFSTSKTYTQQREFEKEDDLQMINTDDKPYEQDIPKVNYCQFCGSKIERDAVFCHECGSKLD